MQYECDSGLAIIFIVEFDWLHGKILVCYPIACLGIHSGGCIICAWFRLIGEQCNTGSSQLYKSVATSKIV